MLERKSPKLNIVKEDIKIVGAHLSDSPFEKKIELQFFCTSPAAADLW